MRGHKIKLPSSLQQNGDTSDDIVDGKKQGVLSEDSLNKEQKNDNKDNEKSEENSTGKEQDCKESEDEEKQKNASESFNEKTNTTTEAEKQNTTDSNTAKDQTKIPASPKPRKKVKSIRFKDEINGKNSNKVDKTKEKDGKDGKAVETNEEDKTDHVNPYLDEWLGVKKKEVDGRYKPGKPPPNRYGDMGIFDRRPETTSGIKCNVTADSPLIKLQFISLGIFNIFKSLLTPSHPPIRYDHFHNSST